MHANSTTVLQIVIEDYKIFANEYGVKTGTIYDKFFFSVVAMQLESWISSALCRFP